MTNEEHPPAFPRPTGGFLRPERLLFKRYSHSVRGKLLRVVMLTTLIALIIAGIATLTSDVAADRSSWASDLTTEADILALSTAPAVAFDDRQLAQQDLRALHVRPGLRVAALYDSRGRLYAEYVAPGAQPPRASVAPARLAALSDKARLFGDRVEVFRRIEQRGQWFGTVYLRARYPVLGRIGAYFGIFLLVTLGSLVLALILSQRLQKAITRPLAAMADVARRVIQSRDYSLRAKKTTDDEIGVVVDAFNSMLDEVQMRDQTLREADRRKDEFLATLAHELRNPLAPIRHATLILESPAADEEQRRWAGEIISRQVQRMALLLDDLLDISRITRGRLELRIEAVDLNAVVNAAIEVARPLLEAKGHTLEIRLPPEPLRLKADPLRLSQALSNLLTNAAKYTDPNGRIVLSAAREADELSISVADTGIGVSAEALERLFQPFTQLNVHAPHSDGGLGIGLALVRGLVALHGGTVTASSPGLGRGTTFTLRLPMASADESEAQALPVTEKPAPVHRSVLVVDDNRDAADTLAAVLRIAGHHVRVAHQGLEALRLASQERPQVLILDIGMPEMNGYELAQRIREESWGDRALLIALTGWGQPLDKQRAVMAGFDHHFTKPTNPGEIERVIAQFARKQAATRTLE